METSLSKTLWAVINLAWILPGTNLAATGLEIQLVPMLKLTGEVGSTIQIQYATDLSQTNNWITLTNIVLSNSPNYFVDTSGAARRFYQAVLLTGPPPTGTPGFPDSARFAWIPPGTFTMGSPATEKDRNLFQWEDPQTQVTISQGFWMNRFEVTQREYLAVMGNNPSYFTGDLNRPAEQVTWNDAVAYCDKLTQAERAAGRLPTGYVCRLPTEAEWEYACRAGTTTRFSYGDDLSYSQLGQYAWYSDDSWSSLKPSGISLESEGRYYTTHPVGTKQPNPWGLYDMHGNVWEWCLDWFGRYSGGSVTDPRGPSSVSTRVYRGGGWHVDGGYCRSAKRNSSMPDYRRNYFGFRVVLAPSR